MNAALIRVVCRFLIASLLILPFQGVQAGMVGTDRIATVAGAQADRTVVRDLLTRSDVASQLQTMGIDQKTALERVATLTDSEVRSLAGRIESVPAGANWNGGWGLVILIVIGVVIYKVWK